jgi:hypothetical protein
MDMHVRWYETEIYKKGVINIGTEIYNNLPGFIKEIGNFNIFRK